MCICNILEREKRNSVIYPLASHVLHSFNPPSPGTIATSFMNRIVRAAVELDAIRPRLLQQIGIDEARLHNPLSRMSGVVLLRLLDHLVRDLGDPAIALKIGHSSGPRSLSDPGYATRFLPNLAATLSANVDLQAARQKMATTFFDQSAKPPVMTWTLHGEDPDAVASLVELSLSGFMRIARDALNEPMQVRRIEFAHAPRCDVSIYEEIFGCPVSFHAEKTAAWLTARQLFRPSNYANPALQIAANARYQQPMEWMAQGKRVSAHTYLYLLIELDKTPLKLDRIAASFGMTERTLRRKLVAEGNPFRELLDMVREDMWRLYELEGNRTLSQTSVLLGYSELSAFSRSRKRWEDRTTRVRT
jgi:AraC-like DNA-binding protein